MNANGQKKVEKLENYHTLTLEQLHTLREK